MVPPAGHVILRSFVLHAWPRMAPQQSCGSSGSRTDRIDRIARLERSLRRAMEGGPDSPVPLLTQAHREAKAARALQEAQAAIQGCPTTPTKTCRSESSPSTTTKPPRKNIEGPEPCLKGVPPMIVGQTWGDWANTPTAADKPQPSPLVLQYAEKKRRCSERTLHRRMEAARVEELSRKASKAVAALQAALPKKKSRSGPSGWTRDWNKAKEEKNKAKEREKKAEVESEAVEKDSFEG